MTRDELLVFGESEGRMTLTVPDYELSDFIDDFLTEECDFEDYHRLDLTQVDGVILHVFQFADGTDWPKVRQWILGIEAEKIERIWRLNN